MYQFEKEYRNQFPIIVGQTDSNIDLSNYTNWLEEKLIASNAALAELAFQVKHYASGSIGTMDYFSEELKIAEQAIIPIV